MATRRFNGTAGWTLVVLAGALFIVPVLALPVLSVAPAAGNKVGAISDFDQDGNLDMQLSDGTVLHGQEHGGLQGNGAIMTDSGIAPMTYALANGTPVPMDRTARFLNTSYLTRTGAGSVLVITPATQNVTVFAPDENGVFHPACSIDFRAASLRELAMRPATESGPRPVPAPQRSLADGERAAIDVRFGPAE